jgi:hypothetical protein
MTTTITLLRDSRDENNEQKRAGQSITASDAFANSLVNQGIAAYDGLQTVDARIATGTASGLVGPDGAFSHRSLRQLDGGFIGDSLTKQSDTPPTGYGAAETDTAWSNIGWVTWLLAHAKADLKSTIHAVSGHTTGQMLTTQLPAALAIKHDLYFLGPMGINDIVTGAESASNIQSMVDQIVATGARVCLISPTPNASFAASASRYATIIEKMIDLVRQYPGAVRFVNAFDLLSDPEATDGATYGTAYDQMTYDAPKTHFNITAAYYVGRAVFRMVEDWVLPYRMMSAKNGLGINLVTNPSFGGATGTQGATPGLNGLDADSLLSTGWTNGRNGDADISYGTFRERTSALKWLTATTFPISARINPAIRNGLQYIVLTSAATGATRPEATAASAGLVPWTKVTPDVGGPVYMVVPENHAIETPDPTCELLLQVSTVDDPTTSSDCMVVNQTITGIDAYVGRTMQAGIFVRHQQDADVWAYQLRVEQRTSAAAKVIAHWGMGIQQFFGATVAPLLIPQIRDAIWVPVPDFVVQPTTDRIFFEFRAYPRAASEVMFLAISQASLRVVASS